MSGSMGGERASIFGDDDFDVSDFQPRPAAQPAAPPEVVRVISEQASFRSREPRPAAPSGTQPVDLPARRTQRRYRTGRNAQLNLKVRPETLAAFHALVDRHGWVQGEAFERAIAALERELDKHG